MNRSAIPCLATLATFLTVSGCVFAEAPSQGMQLMSGDAQLIHRIDTKSAAPGQAVEAKLTDSIKTPEGLTLPRGTELLGRVDQVKASDNRSPAKLVLTFDKAQLKNGQEVAVKATLVAVSPVGSIGEIPEKVASDDSFLQEPGRIAGVSMHSAVQADNSGTLMSKDKNIDLKDGTELLIAVAPMPGGELSAGAGSR